MSDEEAVLQLEKIRQSNREANRRYRQRNPDKVRAYQRKYYAEHKERCQINLLRHLMEKYGIKAEIPVNLLKERED